MRIFCAVRHAGDPRFYFGGLWSGNFYPALRQLGHEIVESQVDLYPASRFMHIAGGFTDQEGEMRARITQAVIDEIERVHQEKPVDLFLSYFYNAHFDPAGFDEIRRLGIPSINFYCNSIYQFELVREVAAAVDFAWHPEKHARASYLAAGANPVRVQMGADPDVYHPVEGIRRRAEACFIGQRYADRDRWIGALAKAGVPLALYGEGWQQAANGSVPDASATEEGAGREASSYLGRAVRPPASLRSYLAEVRKNLAGEGIIGGARRTVAQLRHRAETRRLDALLEPYSHGRAASLCKTFARYEVILNFSNVWADGRPGSRLIPHVRLRDFEAPMCRTCYLTGYTDEIGECYALGDEIDMYHTPEELVDKVNYYLRRPGEAERLRRAGYRRAVTDHTWRRRFEELFRKTGLAQG